MSIFNIKHVRSKIVKNLTVSSFFQFAKLAGEDKGSLLKQKSSLFMAAGCCLEIAKNEKNIEEKVGNRKF